ncbi:pilus assembly FimT family protein [Thioalkalivibrio paradoxus]
MITIAVLVILITLAAPALNSLLENRRLAGAAQGIYEQIQYARTEAIKQSRDMFVVVDRGDADGLGWCLGITTDPAGCDCQSAAISLPVEDDDSCWLIAAVDDDDGTPFRSVKRIASDQFPSIQLLINNDPEVETARIQFNYVRGTVTAGENTTLRVESPRGRTRTATVNRLGRIQTE